VITIADLVRQIGELNDAKRRWPDHPQQISIEMLAREWRLRDDLQRWLNQPPEPNEVGR